MGKCAFIFCINAVTCVGSSIILPHVESCVHKVERAGSNDPHHRARATALMET
jgi:hypothetical protein